MWTLQTAGGDRINVFNNMLERPPWDNSGYRAWFEAMESGQTDRWMNSPILLGIAKPGKYLEVFSVQPRAPDAKPDKTPQPGDIWQLHGWHWWNTLKTSSRRAIRCSSPPTVIGDNGIPMVTVALPVQKRERRGLRLSSGGIQPIHAWTIETMMASFANRHPS